MWELAATILTSRSPTPIGTGLLNTENICMNNDEDKTEDKTSRSTKLIFDFALPAQISSTRSDRMSRCNWTIDALMLAPFSFNGSELVAGKAAWLPASQLAAGWLAC